jgi:ethanolamine ammonia-lyase small subunit
MRELIKSRPASTARISLGQTGPSIPTQEQLRFQLDHALARDAVHAQLDAKLLLQGLRERHLEPILLHSAAPDRRTYLRRPDLGRELDASSVEVLQQISTRPSDVLFILADGLSALAVERHALPLLDAIVPLLSLGILTVGPVMIATEARVALGDQIGELLKASLTVLMIGERPGLSAPDSLGVYLTWNPRPGRTDAERNCVSNIRAEGLGYADAGARIAFYIDEAKRLQTTGIALKDPGFPLLPAGK